MGGAAGTRFSAEAILPADPDPDPDPDPDLVLRPTMWRANRT